MACSNITLSGLSVGCKDSLGGVKELYLALREDVDSTTLTSDEISAITMNSTAKFKKYQIRRGSSSMTSTITSDDATGTFSCQTDVSVQISKFGDTTNITEATKLAKADLVAIVRDNNDKLYYLGYDNYVYCSAGTAQTGTAVTDANSITLTLTDISRRLPYLLASESVLTAVLG